MAYFISGNYNHGNRQSGDAYMYRHKQDTNTLNHSRLKWGNAQKERLEPPTPFHNLKQHQEFLNSNQTNKQSTCNKTDSIKTMSEQINKPYRYRLRGGGGRGDSAGQYDTYKHRAEEQPR